MNSGAIKFAALCVVVWSCSTVSAFAAPPWAAFCTSYSQQVSPAQVAAYRPMMASRDHREWHFLWHAMRNFWHRFDANTSALLEQADPRLRPTALMGAPDESQAGEPEFDPLQNGGGETFLYMHRYMITEVQRTLVDAGQPCIGAWTNVPSNPSDPNWPIDRPLLDARSNEAMAIMQVWEQTYRNREFLASHSLSYIGTLMEITIHNNMHMRWAQLTPPVGDLPENAFNIIINAHISGAYPQDWPFDAEQNDYLGDPYSSHVNPVFWKLHGWIDATIDLWLEAHGYTEIAENCGSPARAGCYQWRDAWLGPAPHHQSPAALLAEGIARNNERFAALSPNARNALLAARDAQAFARTLRDGQLSTRAFDRRAEALAGQAESFSRDLQRSLPTEARNLVAPADLQRELAEAGVNARMDRGAITQAMLDEMRSGGTLSPEEFVRRFGDRRPDR